MKILIAEDDRVSRFLLDAKLRSWGYEVEVATEGHGALGALTGGSPPPIAILDWMMPGLDGVEVTRAARAATPPGQTGPYVILLTAKTAKRDVVTALEAGADDYLTKPFDAGELRARVQAGARIVGLQAALAERVRELEAATEDIRRLEGLLPICSYCKRIRDDQDHWRTVEDFVTDHSRAQFSHGICPGCYEAVVAPELDAARRRRALKIAPTGVNAA